MKTMTQSNASLKTSLGTDDILNFVICNPHSSITEMINDFFNCQQNMGTSKKQTSKKRRKIKDIIKSYLRRLEEDKLIISEKVDGKNRYTANFDRIVKISLMMCRFHVDDSTSLNLKKLRYNMKFFVLLLFEKYGSRLDRNQFFTFHSKHIRRLNKKWWFILNNFMIFHRFCYVSYGMGLENFCRSYFKLSLNGDLDFYKAFAKMNKKDVKKYFNACNSFYKKFGKNIPPLILLAFLPPITFPWSGFREDNENNNKIFMNVHSFNKKINELYWNEDIQKKYYAKQYSKYKAELKNLVRVLSKDMKYIEKCYESGHIESATKTISIYHTIMNFANWKKDFTKQMGFLKESIKHEKHIKKMLELKKKNPKKFAELQRKEWLKVMRYLKSEQSKQEI